MDQLMLLFQEAQQDRELQMYARDITCRGLALLPVGILCVFVHGRVIHPVVLLKYPRPPQLQVAHIIFPIYPQVRMLLM